MNRGVAIAGLINFQAGFRTDHDSRGGWFILPSLATLIHANRNLSFRFNGVLGYKTPTFLEISATASTPEESEILPGPDIQPEQSIGATVEWNYTKNFGEESSSFFNQTFFITRIDHPILLETQMNGRYI